MANVPDIKICYDTNHLARRREPRLRGTFRPYIANIHVSDYDGVDERHWMPGRGIVEWPKVIDILMRSGYDGHFMYEVTPRQRSARKRRIHAADDGQPLTRYALYKKQRAGEK